MELARMYLDLFKQKMNDGADDTELNALIEYVCELISDTTAYLYFYDNAMEFYMNKLWNGKDE